MIKIVSFDIGGTLVKRTKEDSLLKILSEMLPVNKEKLKKNYIKCYICKQQSFESFCQQLQIKNSEYVLQIINQYYKNKVLPTVYDDVYTTLNKLKDMEKTMITISNMSYRNTSCLKSYRIQHFFSAEIYSYEVGYKKPDLKIFRYVEELFRVKPDEILHVGDSVKSDYYGAKSACWNSILLKRKDNLLNCDAIPEMNVISNLDSLCELIEKIY